MCGILAIFGVWPTEHYVTRIRNYIERRGPDHMSPNCHYELPNGLKLTLVASLLHLRGDEMTLQPKQSYPDGNILLFNGQIYEYAGKPLEDKSESDTSFLMSKLSKCNSNDEVAGVLSRIDGPFALVYYHASTNTIHFGRDIFGRKSLCYLKDHQGDIKMISSISLAPAFDRSDQEYSWVEVDSRVFHQLVYYKDVPIVEEYCKHEWDLESVYPKNPKCSLFDGKSCRDNSKKYLEVPFSALNDDFTSIEDPNHVKIGSAVDGLEKVFIKSIKRRLDYNRSTCLECRRAKASDPCKHSKVLVAFSGGLDSTMIALGLDNVLEPEETIDLVSVSFKPDSPDRKSVIEAFFELRRISPKRNWRLILNDISEIELDAARRALIRHLILPPSTILDDSLGCAMWFISRASGRCLDSKMPDPEFKVFAWQFASFSFRADRPDAGSFYQASYTSPASMIFVGTGIDEQLGGYNSFKVAWNFKSTKGLFDEICYQMRRLPTRNMGRDDRVISDHGRDLKLPYLDFDLVSYLNSLPIGLKMDMNQSVDMGPKMILRLLGLRWCLSETARRPKKALQFGTRIANSKERGNDICEKLFDTADPLIVAAERFRDAIQSQVELSRINDEMGH